MNTYIHKTNQRLRVRSDFIRQNPQQVTKLIAQLELIDAIKQIKYCKHAGSVAISFDAKTLDCESLLETLESNHWTQETQQPEFIENAMAVGTKTLVKGLAGIALSRVVGPSVSRMIMSL